MLVVVRYTTRDDLFVEMNGTGMFTMGKILIMMLTPTSVRLISYMATYSRSIDVQWLVARRVMSTTYFFSIMNSTTMTVVLTKLALLLTTVKTKLPRVLGRQPYPLWEPFKFILNRLFLVKVHPVRTDRQ